MILVVVPAYNEEKNIGRVISGLLKQGFSHILVVDDGSIDNTGQVALGAGAKILRHKINRGQGAALETGNEYARQNNYEFVVHFDGDGQFNPRDVITAIEKIKNRQADLLLGSRFLDDRSQIPFLKKKIVLPISKIVNYFLTGVWLSDVHNGFRVLNNKALHLLRIDQDSMAHNTEIVKKAKKNKLKIIEHPVEVVYYRYGQSALGGFKILWDLIIK